MEERRVNDVSQSVRSEAPRARTGPTALVDPGSMADLERRWSVIQGEFVEDPRRAVADAGNFLAELFEDIGKTLRQRRGELEQAGETDTEKMRQELRRYGDMMRRVLGDDMPAAAPQPQRPVNRPAD